MKKLLIVLSALAVLLAAVGPALADGTSLFINGVKANVTPMIKHGTAYVPVNQMARLVGTRVTSRNHGIKLGTCPVAFTPLVDNGHAYLPAQAFAMATGGQVECDDVRGIVLFRSKPVPMNRPAVAAATPQQQAEQSDKLTTSPDCPSTQSLQKATASVLQSVAEQTYATRWLRHKLYWASKLDPANSPYLQYSTPGMPVVMPPLP